jgi:hypothetical protein
MAFFLATLIFLSTHLKAGTHFIGDVGILQAELWHNNRKRKIGFFSGQIKKAS